jgi:hypothetical protein
MSCRDKTAWLRDKTAWPNDKTAWLRDRTAWLNDKTASALWVKLLGLKRMLAS